MLYNDLNPTYIQLKTIQNNKRFNSEMQFAFQKRRVNLNLIPAIHF